MEERYGGRPRAVSKSRNRRGPAEICPRHGSTLSFAPVTRNAATLVDLLSIPDIRTFRIGERLCEKRQRATKKHDKPYDEYTRRPQKPWDESAHRRFADGIHTPDSSSAA